MNLQDYVAQKVHNDKEKDIVLSFYDKFSKLFNLYNSIELENESKLLRAQGKYNSHICFIFQDENHFKSCYDKLLRILSVYDINIWDIVILYFNKTSDNNTNLNILLNEILIINPLILYIYDNIALNEQLINASKNNAVLGCRMINVNNVNQLVEENISEQIFDLFEYLITYNY